MQSKLKKLARASTLPAGSLPPVASLNKGKVTVTIKKSTPDSSGGFYLVVAYPDKWGRDHHVQSITELVSKVVDNLRARYGVEAVNTLEVGGLSTGDKIIMEIL